MTITRNEFKELVELCKEVQNNEAIDWIIEKLGFGVDNPFDELREWGESRVRVKDEEIMPGIWSWHWELTKDLDRLYDYWFGC